MRKIFALQKTAMLASTLLAVSTSQLSNAQDATINITCTVQFTDPTTGANSKSSTINFGLGTLGSTVATAGAIGSTFGTAQSATFSLKDSTGTGTCTLAGGNTAWDLSLSLGSNQLTTVAGVTVLANATSAANGGTNAAVILKGAKALATPATLNLSAGSTNYISNTSTGATPTETLTLTAQFVRTTASAPSNGFYTQTIPVTLAYR
jgi:hypothetical protein